MVKTYWKLFAIPGAMGFSTAALLGRLPAAMLGLAVILGMSKLTGSYATAGAVAAFTMLGTAIGAPLSGRLVDRHGQRPILLLFAVLHLVGLSALVVSAQLGAPLQAVCAAGAVTGASRVSAGTLARTRWAYVMRRLDQEHRAATLQTAYAFESVVDEVVFISGPILVTLLSTTVHHLAGLACCLVLSVAGSVALAAQRGTEPPVEGAPDRSQSALAVPGLLVLSAATAFIGVSAGAVEVAVVARADAFGSRALAGLMMATLAFSSMISGFWYGARAWKLAAHALWLRCLALLVCGLVPFAFAAAPWSLVLALFVAGLTIAPSSIAALVLAERLLPASLLNEGMSVEMTAMALGMAAGGWLSGVLVDSFGAHRAVALPALSVFAALVIAAAGSRWLIVPPQAPEAVGQGA
ncbi:MFS transporter [Sorangium sp. So ce1128]|uniref:MFS transporter n=1 Tax=Sorangium cellulosum TaxID=56 RepID=A0A3S7UZS4_SORCE|nr:MFS transporter [Sorangium cellulosum]